MERASGKWKKYYIKENPRRIFFPEEWLKFINNTPEKYKFYFNFLMQTGMRYKEAENVKVEDIDFDRCVIFVRFAKTRTTKPRKFIKCECNNLIPYSKNTAFCPRCGRKIEKEKAIIKEKKESKRKTRYSKISNEYAGELLAFVKKNNLKKNDTLKFPKYITMNYVLKNTLKKINISDWRDFSIHNIRKTHENYMLALGSNVLSLSQHIGHTIDVAQAYYVANKYFNEQDKGMIKTILGNLKL